MINNITAFFAMVILGVMATCAAGALYYIFKIVFILQGVG